MAQVHVPVAGTLTGARSRAASFLRCRKTRPDPWPLAMWIWQASFHQLLVARMTIVEESMGSRTRTLHRVRQKFVSATHTAGYNGDDALIELATSPIGNS